MPINHRVPRISPSPGPRGSPFFQEYAHCNFDKMTCIPFIRSSTYISFGVDDQCIVFCQPGNGSNGRKLRANRFDLATVFVLLPVIPNPSGSGVSTTVEPATVRLATSASIATTTAAMGTKVQYIFNIFYRHICWVLYSRYINATYDIS